MADLGVAGVHVVTGNHTLSGDRPDAQPVFDLDSTRLAALAVGTGLQVSVAASPHTIPTDQRPARTADKAAAGAAWAFIDQPVDPDEVAGFVAAVRAAGAASLRFAVVVTVPVFADDLFRLLAYPNARVPAGWGAAMSRKGSERRVSILRPTCASRCCGSTASMAWYWARRADRNMRLPQRMRSWMWPVGCAAEGQRAAAESKSPYVKAHNSAVSERPLSTRPAAISERTVSTGTHSMRSASVRSVGSPT